MSSEPPTSPLPDPSSNDGLGQGPELDSVANGGVGRGAATSQQPSFWRRPTGIGLVAALALLVAGGIGAGIALAVQGGNADVDVPVPTVSVAPADEPSGTEGDSATPSPTESPSDALTPSDAASLSEAITIAVEAAGGVGATEIEVERDGWEVEVQRANGTEAKVMVARDGSAVIREEDDDDDDPLIDVAQLPELVRIALEAAGGGRIEKISTDDDDDHLYDVDV
jgi:uncharacterized membrane protein YkoI